MSMKVAIIGAGSILFTRKLMGDILTVPEFEETRFGFTDISQQNLNMVTQLAERDLKANRKPAMIFSSTDRRRVLEGADYIINVSRVGGIEAFQTDIDIPLKYGIDQCVGDTICAGGIMYGQRNIPQILNFCDDIREVAAENALLLNYANPNAMNTWVANTYGDVETIGLCHGVQNGHEQIAEVIQLLVNDGKNPDASGYVPVTVDDVDIICAGINHQTWYIQVIYDGQDWTDRLLEGFERHPKYSKTEKVRIDMLRRFEYYSTESNGHLSEYLPWYRKRPKDIAQWIDLSEWIHGETGGYLRFTMEGRNWFETDFPQWLKEEPPVFSPETRSHEHGSYIIEALETGRVYRGHFNVINNGTITNLPDDCVVEVPGYIDRNGVSIPKVGELPLGCAAVCNMSVNVQRLAVEAAVHGDVALLKQAMMLDPLVGAVCSTPEISQMTDEMLIGQAQWLPQYADEIAEAQQRFESEPRLGTNNTEGAARLKIRSSEELQEDGTHMQRIFAGRRADPGNEANRQVG
ncbi:alpha-glucosidase/alpha-galactosidase [candidate division KSB3 bacterium]|uniref:Alpha-glucosidase/alpha-galactosidase n=1 Tax=candidate division KSB3 bacterium TaxID=2044937 RepID=A0A2G6KCE9_9BACT|nr:MAG: alpha-glucosidase/alpha-galactosidase [candidate division KSB3 bacterium]